MAAAACVVVVAAYGELSAEALVAVTLTGVAVAAIGIARRAGAAAEPVGRSGLPWLAWLALAGAWELLTFAVAELPTLSDVLDPGLAHPVLRGAATLGWLAVGAWLVTRPGPSGARGER